MVVPQLSIILPTIMSSKSKTTTKIDADVVIVGSGPCGLTLAKGLLDLGYERVLVIEQEPPGTKSHDWSKAYSFRVDVRSS